MKKSLWNKNFVIIFITNIFIAAGFYMLNSTMTKYVTYRGLPLDLAGVIAGVITFTSLLIRPFAGRAIDRYNNKTILITGLVIVSASILLYSVADSVKGLIIVRLLHGIGWALCTTTTISIAGKSISNDRLSEGIGIFGLGQVAAMAIAPSIGLFMIKTYGYNPMFLTIASLSFIACICALFIKIPAVMHHERALFKGAFFAGEAVGPLIFVLCCALIYISISGFIAVYADFLNVDNIGIFFSVYAVSLFFSRPIFGKLADRYNEKYILIPGFLLLGLSCFLMSRADNIAAFLVVAVIFGIGFGSVQPVSQAMAMKYTTFERRGIANSTMMLGNDIGGGLGALLSGIIAENFGYKIMYSIFILPAAAGIFFVIIFSKRGKNVKLG